MRRSLACFLLGVFLLLAGSTDAPSQGKKKAGMPIWSDQKDAFGDPLPVGAIARIGTTRYRLVDGSQGFTLAPDGKTLAVWNDESIQLRELPAWTLKRVIAGRGLDKANPAFFQAVIFSADSKKLVGFDNRLRIIYVLDAATGKTLHKLTFDKELKNAERMPQLWLSRDQQTLVCGYLRQGGKNAVHLVQVWDLPKEKIRHAYEIPLNRFDASLPTAVSADARWLAQASGVENAKRGDPAYHLELWDLTTGKLAHKVETDFLFQRLTFSPDGKWLAAAGHQALLRVYDVAQGTEKHNIRLRRSPVEHLEFAPDGKSLYLADWDGTIHRWDPVAGELQKSWNAPVSAAVQKLAIQPEGKILALGTIGFSALSFWDVTERKLFSPTNVPEGFIGEVRFSSKGELFVAAEDIAPAWWNPRTGIKLREVKLEKLDEAPGLGFRDPNVFFRDPLDRGPRRGGGTMLTLSSSAEFLAVGGAGASFYDVRTGKLLYDDDVNQAARFSGRYSASFFDNDTKVASAQGKKVRIWDARTGRDVAKFDIPLLDQEQAVKATASRTGKYFAINIIKEQGQVRTILWDAVRKKVEREWITQERAEAIEFSPDQQWLAMAGQGEQITLTRVGTARGDHLLNVPNTLETSQLTFSPDGRQLAVAAVVPLRNRDAGRVYVFELASKKIRLELNGHPTGIIDRVAYAHDSGLLASGSTDTTVLVWNAGLRAIASPNAGQALPDNSKKVSPAQPDLLFKQMSDANARTAFEAMIQLVQTPSQTTKLLDAKIATAQKPDTGEKTVPQWITDLGSKQFATRTRAMEMLKKLGPAAEPSLRAALAKGPDIESKRRMEDLLDHLALQAWSPEEILHARAVEVLDAIGTKEARAVLMRWSRGDAGALLTREAAKALK